MIGTLLSKFRIRDNPMKFALYEKFDSDGECALLIMEINLNFFRINDASVVRILLLFGLNPISMQAEDNDIEVTEFIGRK